MSPGGGAASGNLADLIVQFVQKGQDELKKSLEDVQQAIGAVVLAVQKMNTQMVAALEASKQKTKEAAEQTSKLAESFQKAGTAINIALGSGVGIIGNFVRQGMAAGAMGQIFGFQMERLALTMSGLFRPELLRITEGIGRLVNWLQSLTDSQKQMIAHFVQGAAAALAVGLVLPRIVAGVTAIITAVKALGVAIASAEAMTGIGAILPVIGLIVQGMTMLAVGTEAGRSVLSEIGKVIGSVVEAAKELWDALDLGSVWDELTEAAKIVAGAIGEVVREVVKAIKTLNEFTHGALADLAKQLLLLPFEPLLMLARIAKALGYGKDAGKGKGNRDADMHRTGGFENLSQTYERIAVASMRASAGLRSPEERTAAATEQAAQTLQRIDSNTSRQATPFAA